MARINDKIWKTKRIFSGGKPHTRGIKQWEKVYNFHLNRFCFLRSSKIYNFSFLLVCSGGNRCSSFSPTLIASKLLSHTSHPPRVFGMCCESLPNVIRYSIICSIISSGAKIKTITKAIDGTSKHRIHPEKRSSINFNQLFCCSWSELKKKESREKSFRVGNFTFLLNFSFINSLHPLSLVVLVAARCISKYLTGEILF